MQIKVIETIETTHIINVTEIWPKKCLDDIEEARRHLSVAIGNIGLENIEKKETRIKILSLTVDGKNI